MSKSDPRTILNLGTDPSLSIYAASTQSITQLTGNTNVFITNVNQSVVEYINTTIEAGAAGNSTEVQFNVNDTVMGDAGLTYNFQTDSLTVIGNVSAGNIRTDHILYANGVAWTFPGSVTTIPGANVIGQVSSAATAGTVTTNAQPNITSVGSLTSVDVLGNATLNNVIVSGSLISSGASPAPTLSGFILSTVSANLGAPSHITITGGMPGQVLMTDGGGNLSWTDMQGGGATALQSLTDVTITSPSNGQVLTWSSANTRWENKDATGGSSFDASQQLHLTNTAFSSLPTNGALVVDGGVGIAGNINADGTKHTLNGNLHITGVDSSSLYIGAYADVQPMTAPVIVAKDSYDTYVQAALINSSQFGSADWVAYSDQGDETQGWADFGMTGSNFNDINYSITGKNDGYFFVQGLDGQGGNMVLATGGTGGEVHRDIVFATGGFYSDKERMRLNHEDQTLYVGAHGDGGTNITNLDVNGNVTTHSKVNLGSVANVKILGGTNNFVLSTDGSGNLTWVTPQSGPAGIDGAPGAKGDKGDPGTNGINGANGLDGVGDTGPKGDKGDTGDQGVSVVLQGTKATINDLPAAPLDPNDFAGHGWIVTTGDGSTHLDGSLWFWNIGEAAWNDIGPIVGPKGDKGDTGDRGLTGAAGENGINGTNGADGAGVPQGGTTGQILAKIDGTDFNTVWVDNIFDQDLNIGSNVRFSGLQVDNRLDFKAYSDNSDPIYFIKNNIDDNLAMLELYLADDGDNGGDIPQPSGTVSDFFAIKTTDGKIHHLFGSDGVYQPGVSIKFPDGSVQTSASIDTGNITFSDNTIGSTNNIVNITGSDYAQLESTDNSSYINQIWIEQAGAYTQIGGAQWSFTTPTVAGSSTNAFRFPNDVLQRSSDYVTCNAGVDTVIYTSTYQYQHTLKLLLNIEGIEDGQTEYDTQSCEMIIAKGTRANAVAGSAYGLVYTSANPLVTLSTRWNAIEHRVEVICRPTSLTNSVSVHSTVTELFSASI